MILNTHKSEIKTSETLDHQVATVSLNPVVMHILSRDLYQKHIESPFREVLTNALDAHIEAGQTKPVEIHLPNMWDEVFYVRDFGKGLEHEAFMGIYLDYGNSTRRDSNDVTGGFGLGTKSPLAYTSSFAVTSYHGGEKRDYLVYYNEDSIPCVDLLSVEPSSETGIKVQFTTRNSNDWYQFRQAAENILSRVLPELYTTNVEIKRQDLSGKELGPLILREGSGINVIMGFVSYKMEESTVLDYLSSKDFKIQAGGQELSAYNAIQNLVRSNCVDIISSIGEYPVHPSREYINITPRAIALLMRDVQNGLNALFAGSTLNLEEDVYKYKLTHTVDSLHADLPVRARMMPVHNNWYKLYVPAQLDTYLELVRTVANHNGKFTVAGLPQFDYTDYLGGGRRSYRYPADFPKDHVLLIYDNEDKTDDLVKEALAICPHWDLTQEVANYRVEKNKERENEQYGWVTVGRTKWRAPRTAVKSMQDPKHNILLLKEGCAGTRKEHWQSAQHNAQSLKDLGKEIYWVPTRIGKIEDSNQDARDIITKLTELWALIFDKNKPVVVGLPASKGTKKIEAEFKPLSELNAWLDALSASPYVQRRMRLKGLFNKLLGEPFYENRLEPVRAYGHADWILRIMALCRRDSIQAAQVLSITDQEYAIFATKIKDLRIKFPDAFQSWGSSHVSDVDLSFWAQQVAEFTNCKPTGAKSKNVS